MEKRAVFKMKAGIMYGRWKGFVASNIQSRLSFCDVILSGQKTPGSLGCRVLGLGLLLPPSMKPGKPRNPKPPKAARCQAYRSQTRRLLIKGTSFVSSRSTEDWYGAGCGVPGFKDEGFSVWGFLSLEGLRQERDPKP